VSISAMKCALQSLESVEKVNGWNKNSVVGRHCTQSAHFLRQAIAEAEKQPVHASDMSEKHVHKSDKDRHEWVGQPDLARVGEVGIWGKEKNT
jgi:predicted Mrr-cat superfamily restriction endonuclease